MPPPYPGLAAGGEHLAAQDDEVLHLHADARLDAEHPALPGARQDGPAELLARDAHDGQLAVDDRAAAAGATHGELVTPPRGIDGRLQALVGAVRAAVPHHAVPGRAGRGGGGDQASCRPPGRRWSRWSCGIVPGMWRVAQVVRGHRSCVHSPLPCPCFTPASSVADAGLDGTAGRPVDVLMAGVWCGSAGRRAAGLPGARAAHGSRVADASSPADSSSPALQWALGVANCASSVQVATIAQKRSLTSRDPID